MSAHLFVGGSRHGTPGEGYDLPTMRLTIPNTGMPPYLEETYVRTDVRVPIDEATYPAIVYVLQGLSTVTTFMSREDQNQAIQAYAERIMAENGDRIREHFRAMRTGVGRTWSQSAR